MGIMHIGTFSWREVDMPYIYVDELSDGQEEADVRSADEYNALQISLDTMVGERDELQRSYDELAGQRDTLAAELDDAKAKFADAFLSSASKMKSDQRDDIKVDSQPITFDNLFTERNKYDAN